MSYSHNIKNSQNGESSRKIAMSHARTPTYCVQRSFVDFDDLAAAARQWDLDLRQLDRGAFRGELLQFGMGGVHIAEARFGRTLNQKGAPPKGLRTIGVPASRDVRFSWRGKQVNGNQLAIFPQGAELSSVSSPEFHVYTCSFPEELLAAVSETLQLGELDELRGEGEVVRCTPSALTSVRNGLRQLCRAVRADQRVLFNTGILDDATRHLPERLLSTIAGSPGPCLPPRSRKRERALVRAEAYIEASAGENLTIRDICHAARVSQRTLEYAFVERYGVPPKAYLTAFRLNAVRRELRAADASTDKVADIANRWSFWHMGQFAADYRRQFGELPSETLRRVNG